MNEIWIESLDKQKVEPKRVAWLQQILGKDSELLKRTLDYNKLPVLDPTKGVKYTSGRVSCKVYNIPSAPKSNPIAKAPEHDIAADTVLFPSPRPLYFTGPVVAKWERTPEQIQQAKDTEEFLKSNPANLKAHNEKLAAFTKANPQLAKQRRAALGLCVENTAAWVDKELKELSTLSKKFAQKRQLDKLIHVGNRCGEPRNLATVNRCIQSLIALGRERGLLAEQVDEFWDDVKYAQALLKAWREGKIKNPFRLTETLHRSTSEGGPVKGLKPWSEYTIAWRTERKHQASFEEVSIERAIVATDNGEVVLWRPRGAKTAEIIRYGKKVSK